MTTAERAPLPSGTQITYHRGCVIYSGAVIATCKNHGIRIYTVRSNDGSKTDIHDQQIETAMYPR